MDAERLVIRLEVAPTRSKSEAESFCSRPARIRLAADWVMSISVAAAVTEP